jgi:hypothetical protein
LKACTKCGTVKTAAEFPPDRRRPDGLHSLCRACKNTRRRELYATNEEHRAKAINRAKNWIGTPEYKHWLEQSRDRRNAYKIEWRKKAGGLTLAEYRAKLAEESAARKGAEKAVIRIETPAEGALHDGHVKSWRNTCKTAWFARRYRTDAEFNAKQKLRARLRKLAADGESRRETAATAAIRWRHCDAAALQLAVGIDRKRG